MAAKFELYKDKSSSWRWRLFASNGQQIAASGEAFSSKDAARGGAESVKRAAPEAAIQEAVEAGQR